MMQLLNQPLGFLLLLTATAAEAQPLTPDVLSEIDMVASQAIAKGAMPGLAIAIRGSDGAYISRVHGDTPTPKFGKLIQRNHLFELTTIMARSRFVSSQSPFRPHAMVLANCTRA